jgi:hypothetical protein
MAVKLVKNPDFIQMELPMDLELGQGESVLKHTRMESESVRHAWYELYIVKIPHGFVIEKVSGGIGCGRQRESWFRRERTDAEKKFDQIVADKINPARRSPRKYSLVKQAAAEA